MQRGAIRLREYQISIGFVRRSVLLAECILRCAVGTQDRDSGVRQDDGPRPPVFRVFEREAGSRLR